MDIRLVDPRDSCWEADSPSYRVYFWSPVLSWNTHSHDRGWRCEEYEITGADVPAILDWARRTVGPGRSFTLYACVEDDRRGLGLIRLSGVDPTVPAEHRPANLPRLDG